MTQKFARIDETTIIDLFSKRDSQFADNCMKALTIFQEKNREYDDAISETGLLGACVEIVGVAARLKPLIIRDPNFEQHFSKDPMTPGRKKDILNALHDLHNYTNIALMMIEDENWRGE